MEEPSKNSEKGSNVVINRVVDDFIAGLTDEHRMLIVLKVQLYNGKWEPMIDDLENRLAGKPYIFKLVNRINDDIERIKMMREFENQHSVDLADYVSGL